MHIKPQTQATLNMLDIHCYKSRSRAAQPSTQVKRIHYEPTNEKLQLTQLDKRKAKNKKKNKKMEKNGRKEV